MKEMTFKSEDMDELYVMSDVLSIIKGISQINIYEGDCVVVTYDEAITTEEDIIETLHRYLHDAEALEEMYEQLAYQLLDLN